MNRKLLAIVAVIFIVVAVGIAIYPTLSEYINSLYSHNEIEAYNNEVDTLSASQKNEYLNMAKEYNSKISTTVSDSFSPDAFKTDTDYERILDITNDGQIGSIDISKINCTLPIYHGTSQDVLDRGAVHMANTSFPIGGENTHAVISAHTAYPGKELFNRLTELEIGDTFTITVLGDDLYYRVNEIDVVLPTDSSKLGIVRGKDLVTLVTCTPYSVNTHRLLVTGERYYPTEQRSQYETDEQVIPSQQRGMMIPCVIGVCVVLTIAVIIIIISRRRRRHEE